MKYFIDTEFIEGFSKWTFAKNRHFIDLISIAIVGEDGREYYAISNEYRYNDADKWVKENVILPLYIETVHGDNRNRLRVENFHKEYGKSNKKISKEIIDFINPHLTKHDYNYELLESKDYNNLHNIKCYDPDENCPYFIWRNQPEFYGYYADYDWVLFCSLFGRMIDLPKGFPMYCNDLKQMLDQRVNELSIYDYGVPLKNCDTLEKKLTLIKASTIYPKQENEHSAIDDARWNKRLSGFIQTL